jgi:hypothetical protein
MRPIWQEKAICFTQADGWVYSRKLQFLGEMTSINLYHSLLRKPQISLTIPNLCRNLTEGT